MGIVWAILIVAGFFTAVSLPAWLIDIAWERKGKWLSVTWIITGLCMLIAGFSAVYALIVGIAKLWDENWQIGLVSVGAIAFIVYFYTAKDKAKQRSELTPKLADEIIREYGAALENGLSGYGTAIRESSLPCPKEKLKQAFKLTLAFRIYYDSLKEEDRSNLVSGLMSLGHFVPDAQADLVNDGTRTLGDPIFNEFVDYQTGTSLAIYEEMNAFVSEVKAFEEFDPLFHQRVCTLIGLEYSQSIKRAFTDYAEELRS